MTTGALIFLLLSWAFVLGLTGWSFARIMSKPGRHDPDGIGPESPPLRGAAERPEDRKRQG